MSCRASQVANTLINEQVFRIENEPRSKKPCLKKIWDVLTNLPLLNAVFVCVVLRVKTSSPSLTTNSTHLHHHQDSQTLETTLFTTEPQLSHPQTNHHGKSPQALLKSSLTFTSPGIPKTPPPTHNLPLRLHRQHKMEHDPPRALPPQRLARRLGGRRARACRNLVLHAMCASGSLRDASYSTWYSEG